MSQLYTFAHVLVVDLAHFKSHDPSIHCSGASAQGIQWKTSKSPWWTLSNMLTSEFGSTMPAIESIWNWIVSIATRAMFVFSSFRRCDSWNAQLWMSSLNLLKWTNARIVFARQRRDINSNDDDANNTCLARINSSSDVFNYCDFNIEAATSTALGTSSQSICMAVQCERCMMYVFCFVLIVTRRIDFNVFLSCIRRCATAFRRSLRQLIVCGSIVCQTILLLLN